ncbi:MAG: hypothetical protein GX307_02630 [Euryarchaeota archaeon]|nr:hypothetical protein [Euryarchaeota archaeon]
MVVKSKRGRRRYIAFTTSSHSREDLLRTIDSTLREAGIPSYKLIQYNGEKGIIRVGGEYQSRAVEALNRSRADPSFSTLAVSGTLRTLRERFFDEEVH